MPRSISILCSLLGYSRQALYQGQHCLEKHLYGEELIVQQVKHIRVKQKRVGGRKLLRMMDEFMKQHGIVIGRDSFFDLLAYHGLLIRKRKRNKPITTDSYHRFKKYKNLIREFIPHTANQLWVSDITYITLNERFAYLSLITDAYSRKIVGFYLHQTLEAKGSLRALTMALKAAPQNYDLIHHSDRGIQYCCNDYVSLLQKKNIQISMTEKGDPLENAMAERVNGILKDELLEMVYASFDVAQQAIAQAISIYNFERLHSSVDYLTPEKAHSKNGVLERHWKNYYKKREVAMQKA